MEEVDTLRATFSRSTRCRSGSAADPLSPLDILMCLNDRSRQSRGRASLKVFVWMLPNAFPMPAVAASMPPARCVVTPFVCHLYILWPSALSSLVPWLQQAGRRRKSSISNEMQVRHSARGPYESTSKVERAQNHTMAATMSSVVSTRLATMWGKLSRTPSLRLISDSLRSRLQ